MRCFEQSVITRLDRVIRYFETFQNDREAAADWIPAFAGMTAVNVASE